MADALPPEEQKIVVTMDAWQKLGEAAGNFWPTIKVYWPLITAIAVMVGIVSAGATHVMTVQPPAINEVDKQLLAGQAALLAEYKVGTTRIVDAINAKPVPPPTPNPLPGAPVQIVVPSGDGSIPAVGMTKITATSTGEFTWLFPPSDLTLLFDIHPAGNTLLVTPKGEGDVIVGAAAIVDGKIWTTWVKLHSGKPAPLPDPPTPIPVPTPTPVASKLYILAFYDKALKDTPAVVNDLAYWDTLKTAGHQWRKIDIKNSDAAPWQPYFTKGATPPSLVILDAPLGKWLGTVPMPKDRAAMDQVLLKYTGAK